MNEETTQTEVVDVSSLYSHPIAKAFLNKVYGWVAVSMLVTAGIAAYCSNSVSCLEWTLRNSLLLALGSLGIVLVMGFGMRKLTAGALGLLLLLFSAAEGFLFGPLLCVYTQASLGTTFACTAGMFAAMSLYGTFTKRDLSPWRNALYMILIGILLAFIVNYFLNNSMVDYIICGIGVLVFALFTAYDTQQILRAGLVLEGEARSKGAILGALTLFLDFINLFLFLLRFLGDRD